MMGPGAGAFLFPPCFFVVNFSRNTATDSFGSKYRRQYYGLSEWTNTAELITVTMLNSNGNLTLLIRIQSQKE